MTILQRTVGPVHFEDFSGTQFERLAFAYLLRMYPWKSLQWLGESGSEGGRDIWGVRYSGQQGRGEGDYQTICVQCKNERRVSRSTVQPEVEKLKKAVKKKDIESLPDEYWLLTGGSVSAKSRVAIQELVQDSGISHCKVMSGAEFEENLRAHAESLLERFVNGVEFPDASDDMVDFLRSTPAKSAREALPIIARIFKRPAFSTPFKYEHDAFHLTQAVEDTIAALNTGVYRMRDGTIIGRIPSVHDIEDSVVRTALEKIVEELSLLRASLDFLLGNGPPPSTSRFNTDELNWNNAPKIVDDLRKGVLDIFRSIHPSFCEVLLDWDGPDLHDSTPVQSNT